MSLWKVIAKYDIKILTNRFRNHRIQFFIIFYGIIFVWAIFLGPFLLQYLIPGIIKYLELLAPGVDVKFIIPVLIEYFLMIIFLIFITYPINSVFRKEEINFKEILLASPVKPGDLFLGEFMGKIPIYIAGVLIFSPIIISLINEIITMTLFHYIIIYVCLSGYVIFSILIGSIAASFLEHKIAKNEKFRDLGKALMFIIAIGMIALIWSVNFLLDFISKNPELKNWLMFYPSLWYSNIILYSIDPAFIEMYFLNIWSSSLLAIFVPLLLLYLAYIKADSFFTLEGGVDKITSIVERESILYKGIRKIIPRNWGTLVIIQLKNLLRKKENIMKFVYNVGLICVLGIIYIFTSEEGFDSETKTIYTVIIIFTGGMMYSIMFGNFIFVGSKDLIWVYKRSPRGIKTLVFSYIYAMLIPMIFIDIGLTIYFSLIYQLDILTIIFFTSAFFLYGLITLFQAVGIQSMNPSFEEKGRQMTSNIIAQVIIQNGLLMLIIFLGIFLIPPNFPPGLSIIVLMLPVILLLFIISLPILYLGIRNLKKIE